MKKTVAILLCISLLIPALCAGAFAHTRGDVTADGRVFAEDARLALRRSVGLEDYLPGSAAFLSADMDGNGVITAADARDILRTSVGLPADSDVASPVQKQPDAVFFEAANGFAFDLFRETAAENRTQNVLVSPLSVLSALLMTANGAAGETAAELERTLGKGMALPELNAYLYSLLRSAPDAERDKLRLANSIWVNRIVCEDVNAAFLRKNLAYFNAGINVCDFNDAALEMINGWVAEQTDGMIERIADRLDADTLMLLLNALAFEASWARPYRDGEVRPARFAPENGAGGDVSMMYAVENGWLENGLATGFVKPYDGGYYRFIALLPKEGVSLDRLIASLTGESWSELLSGAEADTQVYAGLPRLAFSFDTELSVPLRRIGLTTLFNAAACDLSEMFRTVQGAYVSRVVHKTYLDVDALGTRAAAATGVVISKNAVFFSGREVILDRPFVCAIACGDANLPIFIGAVRSAGE